MLQDVFPLWLAAGVLLLVLLFLRFGLLSAQVGISTPVEKLLRPIHRRALNRLLFDCALGTFVSTILLGAIFLYRGNHLNLDRLQTLREVALIGELPVLAVAQGVTFGLLIILVWSYLSVIGSRRHDWLRALSEVHRDSKSMERVSQRLAACSSEAHRYARRPGFWRTVLAVAIKPLDARHYQAKYVKLASSDGFAQTTRRALNTKALRAAFGPGLVAKLVALIFFFGSVTVCVITMTVVHLGSP